MDENEQVERCPACGEPIDYCQGHGRIGDPVGCAILLDHDEGRHEACHPLGCNVARDREVEPRCDICGEPDDARLFGDVPDWNGETGNHLTCEVVPA